MEDLFFILFLISTFLLILGLVRPKTSLFWTKSHQTRGKSSLIYGLTTILFLVAFGEIRNSKEDELNNAKTIEPDHQDSTAIFEYVYPHNTPDLIENHYIILTNQSDKIKGRYYGTSDEFDQAREGYLPGFFVADILNGEIVDDSITFNLMCSDQDMFTKSIDLKIINSDEARRNGYQKWDIGLRKEQKNYKGLISGDTITIVDDLDTRHYIRRVKN
jgi:hypothetical protein